MANLQYDKLGLSFNTNVLIDNNLTSKTIEKFYTQPSVVSLFSFNSTDFVRVNFYTDVIELITDLVMRPSVMISYLTAYQLEYGVDFSILKRLVDVAQLDIQRLNVINIIMDLFTSDVDALREMVDVLKSNAPKYLQEELYTDKEPSIGAVFYGKDLVKIGPEGTDVLVPASDNPTYWKYPLKSTGYYEDKLDAIVDKGVNDLIQFNLMIALDSVSESLEGLLKSSSSVLTGYSSSFTYSLNFPILMDKVMSRIIYKVLEGWVM